MQKHTILNIETIIGGTLDHMELTLEVSSICIINSISSDIPLLTKSRYHSLSRKRELNTGEKIA